MQSPILDGTYTARSVNAAASRLMNMYPEATQQGQTTGFLQRAPGLLLLNTIGTGPIRGLWTFSDRASIYVVSGTELYRVTTATGLATKIGDVTGTGRVGMSDNGIQLMITCNPDGFIYNQNTATFSQITDPDFPGAVQVAYIDGYFVFNEPNSSRAWVCALLDGLSVDPLDFASIDGNPDGLTALIVDHLEAWFFGPNSAEPWYDAGLQSFPLARVQGALQEVGIAAPWSLAKMDNTIWWLGQDNRGQGVVYKAGGGGYTAVRVSTHAVEWQIQSYARIDDATAYTYQQDGHTFYVLTFPSANATWVFDAATNLWHERGEWDGTRYLRHRSNCQCAYDGQIIVGDYENGNIYAFDLEEYSDNGATQRWLRAWRALAPGTNELKRQAHHSLQIALEAGVGLSGLCTDPLDTILITEDGLYDITTEDGYDLLVTAATVVGACPKIMLRWSDDGGHTWSNYHATEIGSVGAYGTRAIFRRLGMAVKLRDRVYEVSGTDPVKIAITGAFLDVTPTSA